MFGLVVLTGVFAISLGCLPYRISFPPPPWPAACADPVYGAVGLLAFPVNVLTDDLGRAVVLAPLALLTYAILGALIGLGLDRIRPSSPGR